MNEQTKRQIQRHLDALVDLLAPIGPKFSLATVELSETDVPGPTWRFNIECMVHEND